MPDPPPLSHLYFYLTEGCNLACRHCWLAPPYDPHASRSAFLPVESFERAVAEARPLGLRIVKLTGGEPLLHPRFGELLAVLERESLDVTIETNGTLLDHDLAVRLKAHSRTAGVNVSVSLDGADSRTHDGIRGVPGSFDRTVQAVRHLVEVDLRPQVIFTVMRANVDQIEPMIAFAQDLGAASLKLNILQPTARGEAAAAEDEALSVDDYIALGRRVDMRLAPAASLRVVYDYPAAFRPLSKLASDGWSRCGIHEVLGVLATGEYALCGIGQLVPELVFGHVGTDSLAALWTQDPTLRDLREGLPARLSGACGDCVHSPACLGGCIAQNYYRTHDLYAPFWFCEEARTTGSFPASRRRTCEA